MASRPRGTSGTKTQMLHLCNDLWWPGFDSIRLIEISNDLDAGRVRSAGPRTRSVRSDCEGASFSLRLKGLARLQNIRVGPISSETSAFSGAASSDALSQYDPWSERCAGHSRLAVSTGSTNASRVLMSARQVCLGNRSHCPGQACSRRFVTDRMARASLTRSPSKRCCS
jgi:hypothetical protein